MTIKITLKGLKNECFCGVFGVRFVGNEGFCLDFLRGRGLVLLGVPGKEKGKLSIVSGQDGLSL